MLLLTEAKYIPDIVPRYKSTAVGLQTFKGQLPWTSWNTCFGSRGASWLYSNRYHLKLLVRLNVKLPFRCPLPPPIRRCCGGSQRSLFRLFCVAQLLSRRLLAYLSTAGCAFSTSKSDAFTDPLTQASNSQNQSPCQVAASLLTVCNGSRMCNGLWLRIIATQVTHNFILAFPVLSLPANSEYVGPTLQGANPCQCNTVTYSLMSACGACQGQDYVS